MKNTIQVKSEKFERRRSRVRAKIYGTTEKPRLSVFKSHKYIYAQIIDDAKGHTVASFDSRQAKGKTPADKAKEVGVGIAKKAITKKIKKVVFDRGGYQYAGKIRAVAEGAREGGLEF